MIRRILFFVCLFQASIAHGGPGIYVPSPDLEAFSSCLALLQADGPFQAVQRPRQPNHLYLDGTKTWWDVDDYGGTFRYVERNLSRNQRFIVEEFNPSLDVTPSPGWLQALQGLGQMPDVRGVRLSEVDRFMERNRLFAYEHSFREDYLHTQRMSYVRALWPGFEFAMSQYPRRKWFTPEFEQGARDTFDRTLRTATYILLRHRETHRIVAVIRMIRVHNGMVRLKHVRTGRTLEILGNAEFTWGLNNSFHTSRQMLFETFEVERHVKEFLQLADPLVQRVSEFEPEEMIHLPVEMAFHIQLPREYEFLKLENQRGFDGSSRVQVRGEIFEIIFGHTVLVEPGLFAIERSEERAPAFLDLAVWLAKFITNPRLPEWIDHRKIVAWTYNEIPLYVPFGLRRDMSFSPFHKHGVDFHIYRGTAESIFSAIKNLTTVRGDESLRAQQIQDFLSTVERKGF